jgi:hypothetical protein
MSVEIIIIMTCMAIGWFLLLYLIAYLSNFSNRHDDDVLLITKRQWQAIFMLWVPCLIGIAIGAKG